MTDIKPTCRGNKLCKFQGVKLGMAKTLRLNSHSKRVRNDPFTPSKESLLSSLLINDFSSKGFREKAYTFTSHAHAVRYMNVIKYKIASSFSF